MSEARENINTQIDIILPNIYIFCQEELPDYILCKPKLMPLKSLTLEKLEKLQNNAEQKLKEVKSVQEAQNTHMDHKSAQ